MAPLVFGYAMIAVVAAMIWPLVNDECQLGPSGSEPALQFLFGLLWPLALVAGVVLVLVVGTINIVGGFIALWRHWRATPIPRTQARRAVDPATRAPERG